MLITLICIILSIFYIQCEVLTNLNLWQCFRLCYRFLIIKCVRKGHISEIASSKSYFIRLNKFISLHCVAPGRPGTGSRPQTSGYRPGTALRPYSALKKRPGTSNSCPAYSRPATMSTRPGSSSRPDTSKSADASSRKSTPSGNIMVNLKLNVCLNNH